MIDAVNTKTKQLERILIYYVGAPNDDSSSGGSRFWG